MNLPVYKKEHTSQVMINRIKVLNDIPRERARQDTKWGNQYHDYPTWLTILVEEVGEVAQAMQVEKGWGKVTDKSDLYKELIQVAAVSVSIAEQVLRDQDDELRRMNDEKKAYMEGPL